MSRGTSSGDASGLAWFKSGYSSGGEGDSCLETATDPATVHVHRESPTTGVGTYGKNQANGQTGRWASHRIRRRRSLGLRGQWGPSKRELKKIATSVEVQTKREATEKRLRERVRAIEASVPWLKPLSVVTYDQCQHIRGNAHLFDPNPRKTCG
ncbi:hypothetical protein SHKM778_14260 [Streptomyces sp. KM77-8]|uniref:DUF397 domain-containing protein n=1 Tax=Streptomyces haneummycinicus TaxID=3074435 RepID=A0AAT9HCD6_9ACTN